MASQFVQQGEHLDYTPGSAVAACDVVVGEDRCVVAPRAIAASALGSIATEGVFQLPKTAGAAWLLLQKLYWDVADGEVTIDSDTGTNKVIGYAAEAAGSAATEGKVLLGT